MSNKDKTLPVVKNGSLEPKINLNELRRFVGSLEGVLLTVIDASIVDDRQCEASKSLMRQMIWKNFETVQEWYYNQTDGFNSSFPFFEK